ncbi:hypothetical protein SteCoe_8667 [Stentor coeruleus]|uniref:Uncharacterized protein n=1 Tax=Stentor coeruleus TaxID=5963 RepID=A0A1R2CJM1_9CILI|nr:hypothetical protein SteCoe_8667 [Stentor coeruleus]
MEKRDKKYKILSQLSKNSTSDNQKLNVLNSLLKSYKYYIILKSSPYSHSLQRNHGASHSLEPSSEGPNPPVSPKKPKRSFSQAFSFFTKKEIYKFDEVEIIKNVFYKLVALQDQNHLESRSKLYIPNYVQFLLDSWIVTQHFMSLFFLPLGKDKWILFEKFLSSFESIQQMSFERASFFYQEKDGNFKKNVAIQKMLFFFKLLEFSCGGELKESELLSVMNLALRNSKKKPEFDKLVKTTFDKVAKFNGRPKKTISFHEFHRILTEGK